LLTSSRPNVTRGRAGDWTPGQALVLLGEAGVGKSALQILITALLTGRFADRTAYFLGTSNFSGEMALVEHWAMSDPEWDDNKQKQKLAKGYKKAVADSNTATEAKYQQTINIPLFKRVTTSINDEEDFQILPLMDKSYLEKLMMLDCCWSKYAPNARIWKQWKATALSQVRAFLYWLLDRFVTPERLAHERYGVEYRNKKWEPSISAPTQKDKEGIIDEIMMQALFPMPTMLTQLLSSTELHQLLYGATSRVRETAKSSNLPNTPAYLGRMIRLWSDTNSGQRNGYKVNRIGSGDHNRYLFTKTEEVAQP
jgi:hypothetical protein